MQEEIKQDREGLARLHGAAYLREPELPPIRTILDELSVQKDDMIVEIGAGDGYFTLPIARRLNQLGGSGVIFACDFSKTIVDRLAEEATAQGVDDRVRAICLDGLKSRTLPFADERVDSVLAVNAIQYLADPVPYLREIARILTPCGDLLIADWQAPVTAPSVKMTTMWLAPEDVHLMLEASGLDAKLPKTFEGFVWAIRAVKPIAVSD